KGRRNCREKAQKAQKRKGGKIFGHGVPRSARKMRALRGTSCLRKPFLVFFAPSALFRGNSSGPFRGYITLSTASTTLSTGILFMQRKSMGQVRRKQGEHGTSARRS